MTNREIFQKKLTELLRVTKVKQVDLAKYAEVSFQTVSAWVKGRGYPRPEAMAKVCQFFGISPDDLLEENSTEKQEQKILDMFRSMSDEGKEKLLERAWEMTILYPKRGKKNGKAEETV